MSDHDYLFLQAGTHLRRGNTQSASACLVWTTHQPDAVASCIMQINPSVVGTSKRRNKRGLLMFVLSAQ